MSGSMVNVNQLALALAGLAGGGGALAQYPGRGVFSGSHALDVGPPVGPPMHGPGGLFSVYNAEQPLISLQAFGNSLATRLPAKSSNFLYPMQGYIGGWGLGSGDEPEGPCEPGPTPGSLYTCWQTAQYGLVKRSTSVIDVANLGQFIGRSEYSDFLLLNPPLAQNVRNLTPTVPSTGFDINSEFILRMMGLAVEFERKLGPMVYYGDPDNSSPTAGGYAEFPGLDLLITTGHIDALRPGVTCTGLDSLLYDFEYADVGDAGGQTIVTLMTAAMRYLRKLAEMTNLGEANWIMAMREELFNAIVDVWPCAYLTNRCDMSGNDQAQGVISLDQIQGMRNAMRTGQYIEIDGRRIEVVTDSWIREYTSVTQPDGAGLLSGQYASDIYILPLSVRNGIAATYWEFLDWDGAPMEAIRQADRTQYFATSDNGRFLWTLPPPTETCLFSSATVRPRIRELTPHLGAHFSNFVYEPMFHTRDVNPTDSFFNLSGSNTMPAFTPPIRSWA